MSLGTLIEFYFKLIICITIPEEPEKIQQACKKLAKFPNLGRRRDELIPRLRSFPVEDYLIFYFPLENGIEIARVVSGYRDLDAMFDVD